jgi:lipid II:glycine glycyltransferase (peptidoglycan interpeptide bridge formation enzyme)
LNPATRAQIHDWDDLVAANPDGGQILQTRAWGEFKRRWGWQPQYWTARCGDRDVAVLVLRRWVPAFGHLLYIPKGPGVKDPQHVVDIATDPALHRGAFLLKVEPEIEEHALDAARWQAAGLRKSPADVQMNRATIVVDLSLDEDALLASFKPKTRYNVRLASRRGVRVDAVPASDENLARMYGLMAETQSRAGFFLRRREYFTQYWQLQEASGQAQLFFASWENQVLAGVFATHLGTRGWYKDGGSVKAHSELMAPHLLQWEVMRWLKARGVLSYDLVSTPRTSELSPEHPLFGLYRFKSGFNEHITEFVGTWDLPIRPALYPAWQRVGERAAGAWARRVSHDLLY